MLKHYLKLELRNLNGNKLISAFKLMGLAMGFIVSFVVAQYTINELSYDNEQADVDNKYILKEKNQFFGDYTDHTPYPVGAFLKENCPGVTNSVTIKRLGDHGYIKSSEEYINLNVDQFVFAEKNLFSFIHFNFIEGTPENCFNNAAPAIISKRIADKHFSGSDAIGKNITVRINGEFYEFTITAIVESVQANTNFDFEWISSIEYFNRLRKNPDYKSDWKFDCENYFQLKEGAQVQNAIESVIAHYQQNLKNKADVDLKFEKVANLHLYGASKRKLVVFNTLAFLILLVSIINYVLLSTADNIRFLKNRGIELISGAKKSDVLLQYGISTFVNVFIALLLAIGGTLAIHPLTQLYFPYQLDISSNITKLIILVLGTSVITISTAAGLRSIVARSQTPIDLLKNKFRSGKLGARISNALMVFQLISFIGLVAVSVFMKKQLNFMQNSDLGFNQNFLITLKLDKDDRKSFDVFKHELLSNSSIISVAGTDCPPLVNHRAIYGVLDKDSLGNQVLKQTEYIFADKDYFTTMQMSLEQGQDLSLMKKGFCIVNKTFVKDRGIDEPIGTQTELGGRMYTIGGVLEDFNQHDFKEKTNPFVVYLNSSRVSYALIRIQPERIDETISSIKKTAQKLLPSTPFEYHFMDKMLENRYKADRISSNLVLALAVIVIVISLMGLLGLSLLMAQNKIKEIGIRKVNGARIGEILALLNKDYIKWVAIAFVIATPIAYYAMNKWLENFAYKTTLSWWIFALAGVVALGIALLTVSFQSWKAATRNPVEALRYE